MSSAFVRRQPLRTVDPGTRPGLHGQVLISSGLAGLDRLLGGGLPLGCVLLLVEDAHSQQAANLAKAFLGEGLCCRHSLALVTAQALDAAGAAALVPPEHAKGSSSVGGGGATQAPPAAGRAAAAVPSAAGSSAGAAAAAAAAPDDGLRIAWQYRKYIQNQQRAEAAAGPSQQQQQQQDCSSSSSKVPSASSSSSSAAKAVAAGIGREWCHHFDLTRGVTPEQLAASKLELHCCAAEQGSDGSSTAGPVAAAAAAAEAFLARFQPKGPIPVPSRDPASIGRLVLHSLGGPEWWPDSSSSSGSSLRQLEAAMLSAVARIRLAVQDASAAAVITCPAGLFSEAFQAQLQHLADAVLCVQSLADDTDVFRLLPDATSAAALLEVRRLPSLGLLRQRHVEDLLHVVRTKRRSISVGVLDLVPPESIAAAATGEGGGGGASKPAIGGCSSAALTF